MFLVPADEDNIKKAYQILLDELEKFNPELLDKRRILGISKSDLIDDELKEMISEDLPTDLPIIFFSAVTGNHLMELKDKIWQTINE